ncbi:MAG: hypothetical protein H6573_32330 [Lewinellaceae bacterium]|nr:hypothetical protein [Lewinellaceae bacterium]
MLDNFLMGYLYLQDKQLSAIQRRNAMLLFGFANPKQPLTLAVPVLHAQSVAENERKARELEAREKKALENVAEKEQELQTARAEISGQLYHLHQEKTVLTDALADAREALKQSAKEISGLAHQTGRWLGQLQEIILDELPDEVLGPADRDRLIQFLTTRLRGEPAGDFFELKSKIKPPPAKALAKTYQELIQQEQDLIAQDQLGRMDEFMATFKGLFETDDVFKALENITDEDWKKLRNLIIRNHRESVTENLLARLKLKKQQGQLLESIKLLPERAFRQFIREAYLQELKTGMSNVSQLMEAAERLLNNR